MTEVVIPYGLKPLLATEEDDQGELACRHGRWQAKKVSETPSPSFAFGAAGEEEPTRRPKGPFPSPPSLLSSCHSIPANYRHGTRSFVRCVGSCVSPPPSLSRCTFSLFLGAMKTPGGRASEVGFVVVAIVVVDVVGCDANINVLQIASLAAARTRGDHAH